jgi:cytochrome bd-type quinol oxidase subunit 2
MSPYLSEVLEWVTAVLSLLLRLLLYVCVLCSVTTCALTVAMWLAAATEHAAAHH